MGYAKIALHEPIFKKKRGIKHDSLAGRYDWVRGDTTGKTRPPCQRAEKYERALKQAGVTYWAEYHPERATFVWEDAMHPLVGA